MARVTVEAYNWTATGYNATYTDSVSATIDDNDGRYDGGSDSSETISIDGGPFAASTGQPYAIKVNFTDVSGDSHVETFNFFQTGGNWYFAPGADSTFSAGATLGAYQSHTNGWDYDSIQCFAQGTRIATPTGAVAVQDLSPGDLVSLHDGRAVPLAARLSRTLCALDLARNPRLRPILIRQGALGGGRPDRDLRVSRQHRMLVASALAERMFGTPEALIAAIRLTALPGVDVDTDATGITYEHLVFAGHEIVIANGAPSESLFPGPEALKRLPSDTLAEMRTLFPDLATSSARLIPARRRQKQFVARLLQNGKPPLDPVLSPLAVSDL